MNRPATRTSAAILLACVLVAAAAGFAWADFGVGTTRTELESSVATGQLGNATAPPPGPIVVHVVGDDALATRLEAALVADLDARGYDPDADALRPNYGRPVLVVAVVDRSLRYDPVSPDGSVTLRYLLVDSGDLRRVGPAGPFDPDTFRERLRTGDPGTYRLDDRTRFVRGGRLDLRVVRRGAVSAPAFRHTVSEVAANRTVESALASG